MAWHPVGYNSRQSQSGYVLNGISGFYKIWKRIEKYKEHVNVVPYKSDPSWIPEMITKMKETLESEVIPNYNENCESCIYLASANSLE